MTKYKTPESIRISLNERRAAIKAAGGPEYAKLLEREREVRRTFRLKHGYRIASGPPRRSIPFKTYLCALARVRGRKAGMESTIRPEDLVWPVRCPVLGLELDYPERSRSRKDRRIQPNWPSLDRWDNSKGYVPGNVFVISWRANALKSNASADELRAIASYAASGLAGCVERSGCGD